MARNLGERIKSLRKELKMTQTDLAGSEMTKSMLSQIENNLAMPSMRNLQYIASRLGKPASYFLDDEDSQSSLLLEEIHEAVKHVSGLIDSRKPDAALIKLEEMQAVYDFDHGSKLYADFLDKYGQCLISLNRFAEAEPKIKEAVDIYKRKFLFVDAAKTHLTLMDIPWNDFDYKKCTEILEEALDIYSSSISKDYAFEIETFYIRSVLTAGFDNLEESLAATSKALAISKQTNIYYRSDELYKNLAVMGMLLGNTEHFDENVEKAQQFAGFTENNNMLANLEGVCALRCNQINKPEEALKHINKAEQYTNNIAPFLNAEKAKSFYFMQNYQQAVDTVRNIEYPKRSPFRYDYLHVYSSKIFEGLSLNKLGKAEEAIDAIKRGIQKMEVVKASKALEFAYKSLSEVYSGKGDYENAFAALKKANEISEAAKENKLYY